MYLGYLIRNLNAVFVKKHGLNAMKEIFLNMARQKDLHLNNFIKKYGSWENVIYGSLKTNPAMDVIVWEENNYERRKNTR
ncbi:hypothetical protein ACT7DN_04685 [Bacillus paranthracis]